MYAKTRHDPTACKLAPCPLTITELTEVMANLVASILFISDECRPLLPIPPPAYRRSRVYISRFKDILTRQVRLSLSSKGLAVHSCTCLLQKLVSSAVLSAPMAAAVDSRSLRPCRSLQERAFCPGYYNDALCSAALDTTTLLKLDIALIASSIEYPELSCNYPRPTPTS